MRTFAKWRYKIGNVLLWQLLSSCGSGGVSVKVAQSNAEVSVELVATKLPSFTKTDHFYVNSQVVDFAFTYPVDFDAASLEVQLTHSADCVNESKLWDPMATSLAWDVPSEIKEGGAFTIYAEMRYANKPTKSLCIKGPDLTIDTTIPTGTIKINSDVATTTDVNVTLNLSGADANLSEMYITNTKDCLTGGEWTTYAASKAWILGQTDAANTVYVAYRDFAGNVSNCYSASITHNSAVTTPPSDTTPPTGTSILIAGGAASTTTTNVTLTLAATDASQMYITNTAGCGSGGSWETYATSKNWVLGQSGTTATVYAKFIDAAGNISSCINDSIVHTYTFQTPVVVNNSDNDGYYPKVGVSSAGTAIMVWEQSDGMRVNIWANRYTGTWGTPELIETNNNNAGSVRLAVNDSGKAMAVWSQTNGSNNSIYANYFNGTSWGTAELIEIDDGTGASSPQVRINSSGHAMAIWTKYDGVRTNVWANYFNGTSWVPASATLLETSDEEANAPMVGIDDSDHAIAVWYQFDGIRNNILSSRFDGTNWGVGVVIETDNGDAANPQIAVNSSGKAIAVWKQSDGIRDNNYANQFDGSTWGAAVLIDNDDSGSTYDPTIGIDSSGNGIAAWTQSDGSRPNLWANRFTRSGNSWGTATLIETENGDVYDPQIAVDSNGNGTAVWSQTDGIRYHIRVNRFNFSGNSWGTAALLENRTTGGANYPQVSAKSSSNIMTTWSQSDGTSSRIWASRLGP